MEGTRKRTSTSIDDISTNGPTKICKNTLLQNARCPMEQTRRNSQLKCLKSGLRKLCMEKHFALMTLKILNCDADCGVGLHFNQAHCETEAETSQFYPFASIFMRGVQQLHKVLEDQEYLPEDVNVANAVDRLLQFLSNEGWKIFIDLLQRRGNPRDKTKMSVALSEHVFSKLTTPGYLLNSHTTEMDFTCMCGCDVNAASKSGNTSIGNPQTWHGYIDILISDVPVAVEGCCSSKPGRYIPVEGEYHKRIDSITTKQKILAQAIVFSFLQKLRHPELDNFLIPSICISLHEVIFIFYDCVNDVLLQTQPFDLTMQDSCVPAVIAIWLVLNYKLFGSGLSENLKLAPKAKFLEHAKKKLHIFQTGLSMGDVEDGFDPKTPNPALMYEARFTPVVLDDL